MCIFSCGALTGLHSFWCFNVTQRTHMKKKPAELKLKKKVLPKKRKKKKEPKKGSICLFLKDSGRNPLFNISSTENSNHKHFSPLLGISVSEIP